MPRKLELVGPSIADDTKRYAIILKLDPTDMDTDMVMKQPDKVKFLKHNQKRVKEIVKNSLDGFDLLVYKLEGDIVKAIIVANEKAAIYDYWSKKNVEEVIKDIYEHAADLWMGGDITLGDDSTELFIELLGIKALPS
jgi:hypothetical protein